MLLWRKLAHVAPSSAIRCLLFGGFPSGFTFLRSASRYPLCVCRFKTVVLYIGQSSARDQKRKEALKQPNFALGLAHSPCRLRYFKSLASL